MHTNLDNEDPTPHLERQEHALYNTFESIAHRYHIDQAFTFLTKQLILAVHKKDWDFAAVIRDYRWSMRIKEFLANRDIPTE